MASAVRSVVARQHHHPDAHVLQLPGWPRGLSSLMASATAMTPSSLPAPRKEEGRFALRGKGCGVVLQRLGHLHLGGNEAGVAAEDLHAVQSGGQAVAGQGGKVGDVAGMRWSRASASASTALASGCSLFCSSAGGQRQQLALGHALRGEDVGDLGLTAGDGAGLIQRHDLGTASSFQRSGRLEEDAVLGTQAVAHHDGHRGGKAQRAGAADDQDGNAAGQRIAQLMAQQQPDDGGDARRWR